MSKAERELLEACAYAVLNLGWHVQPEETLAAMEIQSHLDQINRALDGLRRENNEPAPRS